MLVGGGSGLTDRLQEGEGDEQGIEEEEESEESEEKGRRRLDLESDCTLLIGLPTIDHGRKTREVAQTRGSPAQLYHWQRSGCGHACLGSVGSKLLH